MTRIALFLAALVVAMPAYGQSVVDHYRSLVAQTKDEYAYTLTLTASGWRAKGNEDFARIEVTVDIGNGYIRLNDEGTGGGNLVTEVALFKPASGGPILGLAKRFHNGAQPQSGKAGFYRLTGGRWQELPAADLPPLAPSIFVPAKTGLTYNSDTLPVVVFLPRVGTTVNVFLTAGALKNCGELNWLDTKTPDEGCKLLSAADTHVELAFDKQRGAFSVSRRDRRVAPPLQ
jgi:hypothetical protein